MMAQGGSSLIRVDWRICRLLLRQAASDCDELKIRVSEITCKFVV